MSNLPTSNSSELSIPIQRLRIILPPEEHNLARVGRIMQARIEERCGARVLEPAELTISLAIDEGLDAEGFRIAEEAGGIRISGADVPGLLAGVGKFLRSSRFLEEGFLPGDWRGVSIPQSPVRGIYFASHFHNWYQVAPAAELERYIEDLALWGFNTVAVIFPTINLDGWEDAEAEPALAQLRRLLLTAKACGLQTALLSYNVLFRNTPRELLATPVSDPLHRRGDSGEMVCPNNPEANRLLHNFYRHLYGRLTDIDVDYLVFWPYDEGGCGCAQCAPWGANGYLKVARELTAIAREFFPKIHVILSTWMFDFNVPPEGEWEGLTAALKDKHQIDYIMADAHEDFPRYPLDAGVPGGLPLLNFPEISMWGMYPWGGFGATPLPARFERLWQQTNGALSGGFPYSEGIYEDMNKAVISQCYWDRERTAASTLEEYIAYEFSPEVTTEVMRIITCLESASTHQQQGEAVNPAEVHEAAALAREVDTRLPAWARTGWRWRILFLRSLLDEMRFLDNDLNTPAARDALRELINIYHAKLQDDHTDQYHSRVRPPLA